jgi:transcriptional regulator with XRE-family HTH domain
MSTDAKIILGVRLAALRAAAGLTQEQLGEGLAADGSDVGKGGVSSWEVGRTSPSAAQIPALCKRLNCSASDLFGEARTAPEPVAKAA